MGSQKKLHLFFAQVVEGYDCLVFCKIVQPVGPTVEKPRDLLRRILSVDRLAGIEVFYGGIFRSFIQGDEKVCANAYQEKEDKENEPVFIPHYYSRIRAAGRKE